MSQEQRQIAFGLVGSGWRATSFLQVARQLPDRFRVTGARHAGSGEGPRHSSSGGAFARCGPLPNWPTPSSLWSRSTAPPRPASFASIVAPGPAGADRDAAGRRHSDVAGADRVGTTGRPDPGGRAVPPAAAAAGTARRCRRRAARHRHFRAVSRWPTTTTAISLLRRALGHQVRVGRRSPRGNSTPRWSPGRIAPVIPSRSGPSTSRQVTAHLDFGDRLGIYDFADDQYRSWIRSRELLIRGDRGEIRGTRVRHLADVRTPLVQDIRRVVAGENGNLEGLFLRGLTLGDRWLYRNPFLPGAAQRRRDRRRLLPCRNVDHVGGGPGSVQRRRRRTGRVPDADDPSGDRYWSPGRHPPPRVGIGASQPCAIHAPGCQPCVPRCTAWASGWWNSPSTAGPTNPSSSGYPARWCSAKAPPYQRYPAPAQIADIHAATTVRHAADRRRDGGGRHVVGPGGRLVSRWMALSRCITSEPPRPKWSCRAVYCANNVW